MTKVLNKYNENIAGGVLSEDETQRSVISDLDALAEGIELNKASLQPNGTLFKWNYENGDVPKGIYFYGSVGRGKSMLMDLFFDSVDASKKRRVHFHTFMDELHKRMHEVKPAKGVDPVFKVASDIAEDAQLLCFDEFYISNIADAMMLGRLFEMLIRCGVVLCSTSNWAPENLFQGGFNRTSFKPFIKMIENYFNILSLGEGQDWRRKDGDDLPFFYTNEEGFKSYVQRIDGLDASPNEIEVLGVKLTTEAQAKGFINFPFNQLCGQALAAEHYKGIAERYETVALNGIPIFEENNQEEAMRFVVLVDMFYEMGTKFVCSAEALPNELCPVGESAFAFERTASRLYEMQNRL